MNFYELALSRRSVRKYLEQDISDEVVLKLLEAARSAPSAGNRQPWKFYAVKSKSAINDIGEKACSQAFIKTAPLIIVVCTDAPRCAEKYGERGTNLYCIQDTAAAIQNILLCAKDLGIGTCWIGAFNENAVKEILNIEEGIRPVGVIAVGYPAADQNPTARRPIDEIAVFVND